MGRFNFQTKYKDFHFKGKKKDEEIILLLRRHWIILLFQTIPLFFALIFLILVDIFDEYVYQLLQFNQVENIFALMQSFAWMFFWIFVFVIWIDYYFDVWIVTNKRIINIEQKGLFKREISELEHDKIQDVTTEVSGILATLLKFGFVFIQTAGEKSRFVFKEVPEPNKIRAIIMQLQKYSIKEDLKMEAQIFKGKY